MPRMNNRIMNINRMQKSAKALAATALCLSAVALLAADKDKKKAEWDASKLPPAASKTGLTFEKDIKPILEKSCGKCHSGANPKSKYRMDTLANVIKGGESGDAAILPGNSAKSPMTAYVSDQIGRASCRERV